MTQISFLIKPASSLCNLRCKYCFYGDVSHNRKEESMGIMTEKVMHALIDQSMQLPVSQINYCFQGGEPTCAGIDYFRNFIAYVNQKNVQHKKIQYSIQTNGTLLNEDWVALFKEHAFLVGISIDGFIKNHDFFRKDAEGKGTWKKILYTLRRLKNCGIEYNILTVLTKELARKPEELYAFYRENDLKYVQIIPCLPSLQHNVPSDVFSLSPSEFAKFYKVFFDLWFEDYRRGIYRSVTLFDNVIPMYRGIAPQQCGMLGKCHMQIVVEGNGNVYPCDFYVLDRYCCGNVLTNSLEEMIHGTVAKGFVQEERKVCAQCRTCEFVNMCHGNCKRLSVCYYDETYCGYRDFLRYSRERMEQIARQLS